MALGSKYNGVHTQILDRRTTVLRTEGIGILDARQMPCRVVSRIYHFPVIHHDGSKYVLPVSPPKIYVTFTSRLPGSAYNRKIYSPPQDSFYIPLRDGLYLSVLREDFLGQQWFPTDANLQTIYNTLLNDSDRNGAMYPIGFDHQLVCLIRFRRHRNPSDWLYIPLEIQGIGLEAVHAFDISAPPSTSDGNFLFFFH